MANIFQNLIDEVHQFLGVKPEVKPSPVKTKVETKKIGPTKALPASYESKEPAKPEPKKRLIASAKAQGIETINLETGATSPYPTSGTRPPDNLNKSKKSKPDPFHPTNKNPDSEFTKAFREGLQQGGTGFNFGVDLIKEPLKALLAPATSFVATTVNTGKGLAQGKSLKDSFVEADQTVDTPFGEMGVDPNNPRAALGQAAQVASFLPFGKAFQAGSKLAMLGEASLAGSLQAGGMEAMNPEATNKDIAKEAGIGALFGLGTGGVLLGGSKILEKIATKLEGAAKSKQMTKSAIAAVKEELSSARTPEEFKTRIKARIPKEADKAIEIIGKDLPAPKESGLDALSSLEKKTEFNIPFQKQTPRTRYNSLSIWKAEYEGMKEGMRLGAREATSDLQSIKRGVADFINQALPDDNLSAAQRRQLINAVANVKTVKQADSVMDQAVSIAERVVKRDLINDTTASIEKAFASEPYFSSGQLRQSLAGGYTPTPVANPERAGLEFVQRVFDPEKGAKLPKYKSRSAFLEENPAFEGLPPNIIDGLAGIKTISALEMTAQDAASLKSVTDTLIEQGKLATKMEMMTRASNLDDAVQMIKGQGAKPLDYADTEGIVKIAGDIKSSLWTGQSRFDILDGGVGSLSGWKQTGENFNMIYLPISKGVGSAHRVTQLFMKDMDTAIGGLKPTESEMKRIAVYAYSKQPSAKEALIKAGISEEDLAAKLTEREAAIYGYMREQLDAVKPKIDATMLSIYGKKVGYVDDYFPLAMDYDNLDDVAKVMETAGNGRNFKETTVFGSIRKSRTGEANQLGDIKLHAGEIFTNYMKKALYFAEVEPSLANARNIALHPEYSSIVGTKGKDLVLDYIKKIAREGALKNKTEQDKFLQTIKKNITVATLANFATATKQFTSAAMGAGYIGPHRLAEGISHMLLGGGGKSASEWRQFAFETSNALQLRAGGDATLFEITEQVAGRKPLLGSGSIYKKVVKGVEKLQQKTLGATVSFADAQTAMSVWIGAYKKGLSNFDGDARKAIQYAENIVDRSQVSGHFKDTASIQNNNAWMNLFTPFQTYVNGTWNVISQDIGGRLWKGNLGQKSGAAFLGLMLVVASSAEETIDWAFTPEEYRDANPIDHLKNGFLLSAAQKIPVFGQITSALKYNDGIISIPAVNECERILKGLGALTGDDPQEQLLQIIRGFASLAGLPTSLVRKGPPQLYELGQEALGDITGQQNNEYGPAPTFDLGPAPSLDLGDAPTFTP